MTRNQVGWELEDAEAAAGDALADMTPAELQAWADEDDDRRTRWSPAAQAAIEDAEAGDGLDNYGSLQ